MSETTELKITPGMVIRFIKSYRNLEKASLSEGYRIIRQVIHDDSILASHLCDHWRWKKKGFGHFFLNLDDDVMTRIVTSWSIPNDYKIIFLLRHFVKYFENNGIDEDLPSIKETGIKKLPAVKKCFGNSKNWGDFILSLQPEKQKELLQWILNNYNG